MQTDKGLDYGLRLIKDCIADRERTGLQTETGEGLDCLQTKTEKGLDCRQRLREDWIADID